LEVKDAIEEELVGSGIRGQVIEIGCVGMCYMEPQVTVQIPGGPSICYAKVDAKMAKTLVKDTVQGGDLHKEWALGTVGDGSVEGIPSLWDHQMLKPQTRIVLKNCGVIDPTDIRHYIARDGYLGIQKALEMGPEATIQEVKDSGLRGRGGAGFSTGLKWEFCRKAPGDVKYLICNADEGDPGAFMNRSLLEGDPHAVLEGMLIAGFAIGAKQGYIYIRAEYPLAIERLERALSQMRENGFLGDNIFGSEYSFEITIKKGAGAFVCGEETALMASIMGQRGMPRPRPPFPAQSGLWGKPTNINNVETMGTLPHILRKGGDWYSQKGTDKSKGTKTFSLVGKVKRAGLIEVPLGTSIREVIFEIGGGIANDRVFKAIQTGGPSGGTIPASSDTLEMDYESLTAAGTIMGSGGLIVLDEDTCPVDLAHYFLNFTQNESCGKCTPCRVGTKWMLDILKKIMAGEGELQDIERIEEIGQTVKNGSLCGLGQTAANPVLTTLRYFKEEYIEHIVHKKCRASVCAELEPANCVNRCPSGTLVPGYIQLIKEDRIYEAYDLNREHNPLPAVCGRVCPHPCEDLCRRSDLDTSIAIATLKRGCADYVFENRSGYEPKMKVLDNTGKRVAIIGGGPAGLSAAYFLRRLGHSPTIFEATDKLGGMLVWGIPSYRLPRDVLQQEIDDIIALGVDVRTDCMIGRDVHLEELVSDFDAVFIGVGATREYKLGIKGEDAEGVYSSLQMLHDFESNGNFPVGKSLAVIGGGNAAIDAARTAKRLGAEVTIVYRRERKDMPAFEEEIQDAIDEGVKLIEKAAPKRIIVEDRKVTGLECSRIKMGSFDSSGRRKPELDEGSEFTLDVDTIIVSIGQGPDTGFIPADSGIELKKNGQIPVDKWELKTKKEGVFAGGDAIRGPDIVISAIGDGRMSAGKIDEYLMGESRLEELLSEYTYNMVPPGSQEKMERLRAEHIPVDKRAGTFKEVVQGCDPGPLKREAGRCLRCDIKEVVE